MNNVIKICRKIFRESYRLTRHYGIHPAMYTLIWWINFYCPSPLRFKLSRWALLRKTRWLDKYINLKYGKIIHYYKFEHKKGEKITTPNIWIFWGQGENSMPTLIKSCYEQLKSSNTNVNLITNSNLSDYIDISPIILQKVQSGQITWAHFSDLVRMSLLSKYGGMWIDATGWVPNKIPLEKLLTRPIYSPNGTIGVGGRNICFWTSLGLNWSGWCLWANHTNNRVYGFVRDMLAAMIENEPMTVDYVLIDYLIYYAVHNFPDVEDEFKTFRTLPCENRGKLATLMMQPYNDDIYKNLCKTDFVFKLSFRTQWQSLTPDGQLSFYGKLITKDL